MATMHKGNGRFGVKRVNRMKCINRKCLNHTKNYKYLMPDEINVGFDDVIGHYEAKKELEDILQFLETPEIYEQYGVIPYCKYMIIGHEGDGRSTLACAVAKTANVPIYVVEPSFFWILTMCWMKWNSFLKRYISCMSMVPNVCYSLKISKILY